MGFLKFQLSCLYNGITIKCTKYLDGRISLVAKIFWIPLTHPVRAGNHFAIAVLRKKRLPYIRSWNIICKNIINYSWNVFKNISSGNPLLVVGGGRCDGEIIAFISVPLRIHPVQSNRLYSQNICGKCCLGPCCIDFAWCNIFNVIFICYIIIFGTAVRRRSVVHDYIFGGVCAILWKWKGNIDV